MKYDIDSDYLLRSSSGELFVAKDGNKVVGMIKMLRPGKIFGELPDKHFSLKKIKCQKNEIGYVTLIAIEPKYQGKGIGKKLVEKGLKEQKIFGSKCVLVHAWQGSPGNASEKLFKSLGFEPLKLYKSPWEKHSKVVGPKGYWCPVCGNPCVCDELEMVKYIN
jgi:ribosomal protein S18 acetylase RimI-like enzyme